MFVDIRFCEAWQEPFFDKPANEPNVANWEMFQLAYESATHQAVPSFNGLLSPRHLPFMKFHNYQLEAARRVVEDMNGQAILADEVGLGKTIEAGLILKEYLIRGLVKKVLILTPASLVSQWTQELYQNFQIPAVAQKKAYSWEQADVLVASLDTAKRSPNREIVLDQSYDLVIIDEAHRLKNAQTKNYAFVQELSKSYCLLLTATPVQNKIEELFYLISILKPGHLGHISDFKNLYKDQEQRKQLQGLIRQVMIRNRRAETDLDWTNRHVRNLKVSFSPAEQKLYDFIETLSQEANEVTGLMKTTLKRELTSSKEAFFLTMKEMPVTDEQLRTAFSYLEECQINSKAEKLLSLLKKPEEKVIIFTEYRATQLYIQWFLKQHGIVSVPFRGGFKRSKKEWMQRLFETRIPVMVATQAGGEGLNLQFCHRIVNFDLPWNPMRVEQRIGRVHRIGQTQDVEVVNMYVEGTIEEHIVSLLYSKIGMFETVIGKLDDILEKQPVHSVDQSFRLAMEQVQSFSKQVNQRSEGGKRYEA
ncbi:DEAD/DEAH box helicase [Salsuginibacillus kocurii]|uniref:DEAD/DEAH box helicase n=1 Tax=Salsuginibacillus kocurii TaxID=427078 RepID=UPI00036FF86D|nr:SNF2-related protein [Salsuginibacillus kocurii]